MRSDLLFLHRIVDIKDNESTRRFITKGDALMMADDQVKSESSVVLGRLSVVHRGNHWIWSGFARRCMRILRRVISHINRYS